MSSSHTRFSGQLGTSRQNYLFESTNLAQILLHITRDCGHKSCCTSQETVGTNLAQILLHITRDSGHKSCTNLAAHHKRLWAQILHKSYCTSQEILGTNLAQILLHITRDSGHKSCTNLAQILLHITRDCGPPSLKCHQMPPCPQDEGKVGI